MPTKGKPLDDKTKAMLEQARKVREFTSAGYAGVERPSGRIVDRREHPDALPIPKNTLLDVPEPRKVGE